MKRIHSLIAAAAVTALFASAGAAMAYAPENLPSTDMSKDGGPSGIDGHANQGRLPAYLRHEQADQRAQFQNRNYEAY